MDFLCICFMLWICFVLPFLAMAIVVCFVFFSFFFLLHALNTVILITANENATWFKQSPYLRLMSLYSSALPHPLHRGFFVEWSPI